MIKFLVLTEVILLMKKFRCLSLGILTSLVLASAPVFATTNNYTQTISNQVVQANIASNKSNFKFIKSKVTYIKYTYANAPSDTKKQYENNCKSINKTPSLSDKIYVPATSKNISIAESSSINYSYVTYIFGYDSVTGTMLVIDPYGNNYYASTSDYVGYGHITSGSQVICLQVLLNELGYNIDIDEIFGSQTQGAVLNFQSNHALSPDGIVGPKTWNTMLFIAGYGN